MFKRIAFFSYGLFAYLMFLGVFVYAVGFVGGFLTPTTLDAPRAAPLWQALLVNLGLLSCFALQHSVMARPAFKRIWTKIIPHQMERPTYVLATNLCLIALFAFWQPIGVPVWSVEHPVGAAALYALYGFGWLLLLVATFQINHFDLFGLRHAWFALKGQPYRDIPFRTPPLYRIVRHPLYVAWITIFWATPTMTLAHLLFAAVTTCYILVAITFEERDLIKHFGSHYVEYRKRVPMLIPGLRPRAPQPELVPEPVPAR